MRSAVALVALVVWIVRTRRAARTRRRCAAVVTARRPALATGRALAAARAVARAVVVEDLGLPAAAMRIVAPALAVSVLLVSWLLLTAGPVVAGLVLAGLGVGVLIAVRMRRDRRLRRLDGELIGALDTAAGSLRAGATMFEALQDGARRARGLLGADLDLLVGSVTVGVPLCSAVELWAARRARPAVRLASAAIVMATTAGGAAAPTIEGVASTLRARQHARDEARTMSAQARASMVVLVGAPVAFVAFIASLDGAMLDFLCRTPSGLVCLGGGVALDALGGWWMHRLVRRAEP